MSFGSLPNRLRAQRGTCPRGLFSRACRTPLVPSWQFKQSSLSLATAVLVIVVKDLWLIYLSKTLGIGFRCQILGWEKNAISVRNTILGNSNSKRQKWAIWFVRKFPCKAEIHVTASHKWDSHFPPFLQWGHDSCGMATSRSWKDAWTWLWMDSRESQASLHLCVESRPCLPSVESDHLHHLPSHGPRF